MLRSSLFALALLSVPGFAQSDDSAPMAQTPVYAGTYVLATGELIAPSSTSQPLLAANVVYNNSCPTGYFSQLLNGSTVIDDGRVPSATSQGTLNHYRIDKFEIQYCTKDVQGVFSVRVRFWQDLLGNATTCTALGSAGSPLADFTLTNVPGATTPGVLACYTLTVDLTGQEFCLLGDANGVYDADTFENGFGYGLTMLGQAGTTLPAVGGFAVSGRASGAGACNVGDGTYFQNPGNGVATGLDDDPTFYRDGKNGQSSGCLTFGGGITGAAGYYLKLAAKLSDCTTCSGNPDADGDGLPDCVDGCPNDPAKSAPGQCGCGTADTDSDGDGTADCNDLCPNDPAKLAPGQCGCGVADTDSDGDGTSDCNDLCPSDPGKTAPGQCGCGIADTDSDGDGTADCNDACPFDPAKLAPGICGCGVADVDSDGDGTYDCFDACPNDPAKIAPGACGCGVADTDSDGDGTADCNDGCPLDPNKLAAGQCGCGTPDTDTDGDGVADCVDNCDAIANPGQEDCNANGIGDACDLASHFSVDTNSNGVPDECEVGVGIPFCFGDGSQTACPCGNSGASGSGCANSSGWGALLYNLGGASVGAGDTAIHVVRLPANKFGMVYMGTSPMNPGSTGVVFGDGLRCVKGFIKRFALHSSGAAGSFAQIDPGATAPTLVLAGTTWFFQAWYRDPTGPCGTAQNLSNALRIDFQP
jgi:hypothetical protein